MRKTILPLTLTMDVLLHLYHPLIKSVCDFNLRVHLSDGRASGFSHRSDESGHACSPDKSTRAEGNGQTDIGDAGATNTKVASDANKNRNFISLIV